jgi:hypothetical protein
MQLRQSMLADDWSTGCNYLTSPAYLQQNPKEIASTFLYGDYHFNVLEYLDSQE